MRNILIKPAAEEDLIHIWVFIARDNPKAADRVYKAAEEAFETIAGMPAIGTLYRAKRAALRGLRFFPIKQFPSYVIYYRATARSVEIIRVLHAHREKHTHLEPKKRS